jgi:hypothetical protein
MSAMGAAAGHPAATGAAPPMSPADVSMQSWPPVSSGAAATPGLNATATPHNPATAPINPMLNRSKIVIDVDSFVHAHTLGMPSGAAKFRAIPKPSVDDGVNYQQETPVFATTVPCRIQMVTSGQSSARSTLKARMDPMRAVSTR